MDNTVKVKVCYTIFGCLHKVSSYKDNIAYGRSIQDIRNKN